MRKTLSADFFDRPTMTVARDLVGKFLVREMDDGEIALMITETEAYHGFDDRASHARFGKTARTAPMFGKPGTIYAYFIYGMHWMLNIACGKEHFPAAVLIRGAEGFNGPGRLAKALRVEKGMSGLALGKESGLWIEDRGIMIPRGKIKATPRIGIDYAGAWAKKEWRFVLEG
jgi:DNA-3-methyladenine glycosylase